MFSFLKALEHNGWECKIAVDAVPNLFYASDRNFYYRCLDGRMLQIGVKEHFDRWANSIDFVCKIPKHEKMFKAFILALKDCLQKERYAPGWGQELNINFLIRKAARGKL